MSRRALVRATVVVACCSVGIVLGGAVQLVAGLILWATLAVVVVALLRDRGVRPSDAVAVAAAAALGVPALGGVLLHGVGLPLTTIPWLGLFVAVALSALLATAAGRTPERVPPARRDGEVLTAVRQPLLGALAVAVLTGAVIISVLSAHAQNRPGFTQLWLVQEGQGATMGVRNHEGQDQSYRAVLSRDGQVVRRQLLDLKPGQSWEQVVPWTGARDLDLDLYLTQDDSDAYRSTHLAGTAAP